MRKHGVLLRSILFLSLLVIAFLVFGVAAYADASPVRAQVSADLAGNVAENHLRHSVAVDGLWGDSDSPSLGDSALLEYQGNPVGYCFKVNPSGYILVPYWKAFSPVILYSTTSNLYGDVEIWITSEIYEVHRLLLEQEADLASIVYAETAVGKAWEWLGESPETFSLMGQEGDASLFATVGPLLTTMWGQGSPYNRKCPGISGQCTHCIVGCVATAWSQVMKYWDWPTKGTGSHSYSWNSTTLSANFNTTYDWANMPNVLTGSSSTTQKNAVAKLCKYVGISADMNYGCGNSGSNAYADGPMPTYFKYKSTAQQKSRGSHGASAWFNLFKTEFDANPPRPVVLSIWESGGGGHETVADGYNTTGTDKVHINFGWNGGSDGWYDVTNNFAAGGYNWQANSQVIVIKLEPDKPIGPTGSFNAQFNDWKPQSGSWYLASGKYLKTGGVKNKGASVSYVKNTSINNLDYRVRMQRTGCDSCANRIIIRGTPKPFSGSTRIWRSGYLFQYSRNGKYSVWRFVNGTGKKIKGWTYSSAINKGTAWNTLRVVANGKWLKYYINGTLVWSGSDTQLTSGQVGIGMYRNSSTGNALYVDWAKAIKLTSAALGAEDEDIEEQSLEETPQLDEGGDPNQDLSGAEIISTEAMERLDTSGYQEEADVTSYDLAGDDKGASYWFNTQFNDWKGEKGIWYIVSGKYLKTKGAKNKFASVSHYKTNSNLDYRVKMKRTGCQTCANKIMIRGTPAPLVGSHYDDWHNGYFFEYAGDGQYCVYKQVGGTWSWLKGWTASPAINKGSAWNTLRVVANGSSLKYYINGTLVWSGTDSSLTSGQAGIGMYRDTSSGNALYVDWAKGTKLASVALGAEEAQVVEQDSASIDGGDPSRSE